MCAEPWVQSFGVIDRGFEAMRAAWPKLGHMFSVRSGIEGEIRGERCPEPRHVFKEPHQLPNRLLRNTPVDLLTVERGFS